MDRFINSDFTNPEMLASQTFDQIIDSVQKSNLNFQLQVSPFSAYISLKKSLVKDKSGSLLLPQKSPPLTVSSPQPSSNSESAKLIIKINELESALVIQKNRYEDAVKDNEVTNQKLKDTEKKVVDENRKLEIEKKALRQEIKTYVAKLEDKVLEVKKLKNDIDEQNKEKNALNVALKSAKQDVKSQSKAFEKKLTSFEKKVSELTDFKTKKLNEERLERVAKKKELKREAKKVRNEGNNNVTENNVKPIVDEKKNEENEDNTEHEKKRIVSELANCEKTQLCVMGGKPSLHPDLDPGELAPNNSEQLLSQSANGSKTMSTETSDLTLSIEYGNGSCSSSMVTDTDSSCAYPHSCALDPVLQISADTSENNYTEEEKEEGFVGPRLPRMMNNKEFKALMDKFFGDKYD